MNNSREKSCFGWIQTKFCTYHREESGAIALLGLAGILITLMVALMMFDAGRGSRDKIDVQVGADTAAFSQASVKARSMNMIAYGNNAKRIFYGYSTIYTAAYLALLEVTGYFLFKTAKYGVDFVDTIPLCVTIVGCAVPLGNLVAAADNGVAALKGVAQIAVETIEFFGVNQQQLFSRGVNEIRAIDTYQTYMAQIAPWWGWSEGLTRGLRNGASITTSWPVPAGNFSSLNSTVKDVVDKIPMVNTDAVWGHTGAVDALPLEKVATHAFISHGKLCGGMLMSPEFWAMQYYNDHWRKSEGYWDDDHKPIGASASPKKMITGLEITQMPVGCIIASMTMGDEVLPFELRADLSVVSNVLGALTQSGKETSSEWLQATSNVTFAYKKGPGRFDGKRERQKYNYISKDYGYSTDINEYLFTNDGYWALSRSEIVFDGDVTKGVFDSFLDSAPGLPSAARGMLRGLVHSPDMWSPGWTSRMRPMHLPGEELPAAGMSGMFHDTLGFFALGAPVAFLYENGNSLEGLGSININQGTTYLKDMGLDLLFMERATRGLTQSRMQSGMEK